MDQASCAAAFPFLSGMRGGAFVTLRVACVKLSERTVMLLPEMGAKTKFKKAAITRLLEIPDPLEVVNERDAFVRLRLLPDALWYRPTDSYFGKLVLSGRTLSHFRLSNRRVRLKHLFQAAGLSPMSPHKFRHGHTVFGLTHARDIADLKAVSKNLMHSNIGITDGIYSALSDREIQEHVRHLSQKTQLHKEFTMCIVFYAHVSMESAAEERHSSAVHCIGCDNATGRRAAKWPAGMSKKGQNACAQKRSCLRVC